MVSTGPGIRFCPVCGKAFPPGARFCPDDGVSLVDAPRGGPPVTVVPPTVDLPPPPAPRSSAVAPPGRAPAPAPAPDDDLPTHRPSAVPPLSTDVVRAAIAAPTPPPPIFTDTGRAPGRPREAPAPLTEYIGRTIYSQFVVEELCGVGSTGTVFRARQLGIGRPVALKVLHPDLKSQPEIVARFQREAQIASRISHPNIVHLYLAGLLPDGNLFLAMEFVTGVALSSVVPPEGLPLERAIHIIEQVLAALGEAHRAGIVHRDLKPENVMLTRVGDDPDFVKVLDFGIARVLDHKTVATRSGLVFGSPKYISPEAAAGDPADARSDIYSCGILLYEMLAGRPPFDAEKPIDVLMKHVREEPPRLSSVRRGPPLPPPVELVVHQAIEKSPDRRFRTAEVFAQALRNAARTGELRPAASPPRLPPASFLLPEKPVQPEKSPATPGAAAHPIPSPARAMVMARPAIPAAPAPPAGEPPGDVPPVAPTPKPAPPFAIAPAATAPAPASAPAGPPAAAPDAPFAIAPAAPAAPLAFEEDSIAPPQGRGRIWIAVALAAVALGLLATLLVVLLSGGDSAARKADAIPPADAGATAPAASGTEPAPGSAAAPSDVVSSSAPALASPGPSPASPAGSAAPDAGEATAPPPPPPAAPDAGSVAPPSVASPVVDASPSPPPSAAVAIEAGSPPSATPDVASGSPPADGPAQVRRDAHRRDAGRAAATDTAGDFNLRPFPGPTPLLTVTSPKDIGR